MKPTSWLKDQEYFHERADDINKLNDKHSPPFVTLQEKSTHWGERGQERGKLVDLY